MIVDDSVFENEEQFGAMLELPAGSSGVILGPQRTATANIQDDDGTQLSKYFMPLLIIHLIIIFRGDYTFQPYYLCGSRGADGYLHNRTGR